MLVSYEFLQAWLDTKARSDKGASLVEYALLVALIAVVCIAAVATLGNKAASNFDSLSTSI